MSIVVRNIVARMQKSTVITLCVVCIFGLFSSVLRAQTTENVTWDYPVRPGSEEILTKVFNYIYNK